MRIVAESQETVRIPLSAILNGVSTDPSNAGVRSIGVALTAQGTYPSSYAIAGVWEQDGSGRYWVTFAAPGNLTRGIRYVVRVQLGTIGTDHPILEADGFLDAV